ncbi:MAG TPA: glutaredoxin family protein [Deltaproteobacteria bacterium]|nr:glutaredoxin family protein [Deltaproteobacteria bacterium]
MTERYPRGPAAWLPFLGALLLIAGVSACDRFDPGSIVSRDEGSGKAEPTPTRAGERPDSDMASVGPEEALRVYYQFVDDHGKVRFVERLGDVPAAWRDQVGYVEMSQPPPLTPMEARRSWQLSSERATEIMLANRSASTSGRAAPIQEETVILYSATWCGYCRQARAHLDEAGIRYEIRDVDDEEIARELREKTGRGGVPVLDFSGEILRGYSREAYERAIRSIRG